MITTVVVAVETVLPFLSFMKPASQKLCMRMTAAMKMDDDDADVDESDAAAAAAADDDDDDEVTAVLCVDVMRADY